MQPHGTRPRLLFEKDYDELAPIFAQTPSAGLDALLAKLGEGSEHHALFRAKLLKRRAELNLPLINPGELKTAPEDARKAYEAYVESVCHEICSKYLAENNIAQAWRYFRTIGEIKPIREALEKIDPKSANDEILDIALGQSAHPLRGFEITLERDGLCRAISTFDSRIFFAAAATLLPPLPLPPLQAYCLTACCHPRPT